MIDLVEFHSVLRRGVPKGALVLDLGANKGSFSRKMASRYGARCVQVEANPQLCEMYLREGAGKVYNIAISGARGEVALRVSENNLASSIMTSETSTSEHVVSVEAYDLESFCQLAGIDRIDLLKVDIEGAEIDMLNAAGDAFLARIPQITIEFHDFCGLTPDRIVNSSLVRLQRLGFEPIRFSRVGHQDTLLINRNLVPVSNAELFWLRHGYRNIKGLARMVRKAVRGKEWALGYA